MSINKIEGINSSEIGKFPKDWALKSLGEIGLFSKGSAISKSSIKPIGFPAITYGEIYTSYDCVIRDFLSFIDETEKNKSTKIPKNSVLFAGSGETHEEIGKCVAFTRDIEAYAGGDIVILEIKEGNPIFISYFLNSSLGVRQKSSLGQGYSIVHVYKHHLEKIIIPYPPTCEQNKIAAIIEQWDRVINLVKTQIKAKRKLKKALMQQLLTGKLRFPKYGEPVVGRDTPEGWILVKLSEYFKEKRKRNHPQISNRVLSCSKLYGIIAQSERFEKRIASTDVSRYKVVRRYDLVYDPMLLWDASIGFVENYDVGVVSPAYCTFEFIGHEFHRRYLIYLLSTHELKHYYKVISQGTNRRRRKAPSSAFLDLGIKIPSNMEEMKAIILTLESMDVQISLLQNLLMKLREQKRGLVQKLLTGKIRVNA